jgi:prepilin-type N-terminal cleavage/methylation domain-containing protein/prepilin-type processing-associated H-X9-DG protein
MRRRGNISDDPQATATWPSPRRGLTMIELIVVTAIIAMLVALALPAVTRAREAARKTRCLSNLRNITFALTQFDHFNGRLPASGYYFDPPSGRGGPNHSWAVSILPFVEQQNLFNRWDLDKRIIDPENQPLTESHIEVYVCPMDITRSDEKLGDLSYAVNGGWGFTIRTSGGVGDCPIDWHGRRLDLNGDGQTCTGTVTVDDLDRDVFKKLGLFFLENWKVGGTERHHSIGDVHDGTSQTFLVTENVRTGYAPDSEQASFADPNPYRSAFYVGNPCRNGVCSPGNIDYAQCNSGEDRINSGLWSPEGRSPVPNSFHAGGVNMAYVDGHVTFLAETIDGAVYAALASPQGLLLKGTPLQEVVVSGGVP